ncbi:MAG: shikimate dehydrogenase [Mangrovibacterium sp.]
MSKEFGLIGYRLGHSFSQKFFMEKFRKEKLSGCTYLNFELDNITGFPRLLEQHPDLCGLNCTIPYKQQIIPYLDEVRDEAARIGAVNTIRIVRREGRTRLEGYNTDAYGFEQSIRPLLTSAHRRALILGTGGASRAVKYVLGKLNIGYLSVTTKASPGEGEIRYSQIDKTLIREHRLIIQATPLGMYPRTGSCPDLPYHALTAGHLLYDLVYNPEQTLFMQKGLEQGAVVKNGLEMLHMQAIRAWEIWNTKT